MQTQIDLRGIFRLLKEQHVFGRSWPDGDWPVGASFQPERLEVVVGAVLTQHARWENVELALDRLVKAGLVTLQALFQCPLETLQEAVRPAGYFRQKAATLKRLADLLLRYEGSFLDEIKRDELLRVKGIGPETADAILLYAAGRPCFVVDAYTRRILERCGLQREGASYDTIRRAFETQLPRSVSLYRAFHALLVEHAKRTCTRTPRCSRCALKRHCRWGFERGTGSQGTPNAKRDSHL